MLPCVGSRCWTKTKAMPVRWGRCRRSSRNASRPPAEAPTPTMGKRLLGLDGSGALAALPPGIGAPWRATDFPAAGVLSPVCFDAGFTLGRRGLLISFLGIDFCTRHSTDGVGLEEPPGRIRACDYSTSSVNPAHQTV